jgi:P27 family predicted phage terminase small subunit
MTTRGPRPLPARLKLLYGNPSRRPIKPEPQPDRGRAPPDPPAFLTKYGREEWTRLAEPLWKLGLLTPFDHGPFAAYCGAFGLWRFATEALAENPARRDRAALARMARDAAAAVVKFGAEFGLSPSSRSRVTASEVPPGRFTGLLGRDPPESA